ncbi:MAG: UDP-N-acetyl-alpha-D-muramoyl-L-alanyl-L-glutamate epimerase [Blastocatellia bacterium]|nr:UDP-N-acetyl-alpha-D-muramoyl-L-alanyl-L-glutamate epimerase [Blastocatellia bacterium]
MDRESQPLLDCAVFSCTGLQVDLDSGEVALDYLLSGGSSAPISFTERLRFPVPARQPSEQRREAFLAVLRLLHAVAGVSYFKAAAPPVVDLGASRFTAAELAYVEAVYRHGLREFAYTNDLPAVLHTRFVAGTGQPLGEPDAAAGAGSWYSIEDRPLVPCGGGKDSIVSTEAMISSGRNPIAFAVNPNSIISGVVAASGLELLAVRRTLDRRLFELNRQGAYNGHVPVTAVNSLLAVATSILHGLGPVVMSNESSASAPNLSWRGEPVNHQWSKSGEAEQSLQAALASRLGTDGLYFSLLRHHNEMQIARLYAGTTAYDGVLTSCNNAYTIDRPATVRWCGDCPKCRFVFLALAPFAGVERMVGIFGANLLADEAQLPGYRVLLGIGGYKPFECVGEISESQAAVARLAELPAWREAVVIRRLLPELDRDATPAWTEVLDRHAASHAPAAFVAALDSLAGAAVSP